MLRVVSLAALAATAHGHAGMFIPSPRNADDRFLPGWQNGATPTKGGTQCTCADGLPTVAPFTPPAEDAAAVDVDAGECWTDSGMNYNNHAHNIMTKPATTPAACCDICSTTTGCKFWTHLGPTCWLKNSTVGRTKLSGAVSGGSGTKPHFPPPSHSTTEGPECDQGLRAGGGGQPCLWWSQGCSIGCDKCATDLIGTDGKAGGNPPKASKIGFRKRFCNASYNSEGAPLPMMNATLPRKAWTMNVDAVEGSAEDSYRFNPWRAPGYAPVVDACGMAGGKGPHQNIGGDSSFTTTSLATMGDKGSTKLKPTAPENRTHWKAGTSVEVAWGIRYNHGGGYQYRLCPANQPLTEDCMQKMPLEFDLKEGTSLVWNNGSRYKIENVFVSEGTWPKGSTWARNPIPRVNDDNIGQHDPDACKGPLKHYTPGCIQFPPVCPQDTGRMPWSTDGSGQGACSGDWTAGLIADRVIIPKTLPPGDYVLGWRWDCEETAQIWANCADVTVTAADDA